MVVQAGVATGSGTEAGALRGAGAGDGGFYVCTWITIPKAVKFAAAKASTEAWVGRGQSTGAGACGGACGGTGQDAVTWR